MLVGFLIYILYLICCTFETIYFPPKNNEFIERLPIFIPRVINSWGITLDNYIYRLVKLFFVKIRCFTDVTSGTGTAYPSGTPEFTPSFQWGSCYSIFSFLCMFCRSMFALLSFFFWPLCCLSFLDLRILNTPLVSSSSLLFYAMVIIVINIIMEPPLNVLFIIDILCILWKKKLTISPKNINV